MRISPDALMLREEEHRENTSLPPNPVIANIMYLGGLIEHWGRGLSMMASECERVGLPVPSFYQNGTIVKICFARPKDTDKDTVGVSKSTSKSTSKSASNSTSRNSAAASLNREGRTIKTSLLKLIGIMGEDWLSLYDMLESMRFTSRFSFTKTYLKPAIREGLVALENPDKPNAPNQRYGLTLKGKALYYERLNNGNDLQNDHQTDLSGQNDPINDPINLLSEVEKYVLQIVREQPGISRINITSIVGKSEATVKRALKVLGEMGFIEYRGSNKTGGYFSL